MNTTTQYCVSETVQGCSIFTLNPSMNDVEWAEIENVGNSILANIESQKKPAVVIDLTKLEYMGSAMVALIVRVWKKVEQQDGKMVVANSHELVYEVLKLAGLTKMWTVTKSREEAIRELGGRGSAGTGGGLGLVLLGIVSVIGALAGLWILMSGSDIIPQKAALIVEFGFAAFGIIIGTLLFSKPSGASRGMGLLIIVACLAIAVCGIVKLPEGPVIAPPEDDKTKSSEKSESDNKAADHKETPEPETPEAKKPEGAAKKESTPQDKTKPAAKPKEPAKPKNKTETKKPE